MAIAKNIFVCLTILAFPLTFAQADAPDGEITVRTNRIGELIAAFSRDGRFFGIKCSTLGVLGGSSADLLFTNSYGDINLEKKTHTYAGFVSQSVPLTKNAVEKICNHPNGLYTLRIRREADGQVVDFVTGSELKTDSRRPPLGY